MNKADAALEAAKVEDRQAGEALAQAEAETALSGGEGAPDKSLRKRITAAREGLESCTARVEGLDARFRDNTAQLRASRVALDQARAAAESVHVGEARIRVLNAASRLQSELREIMAEHAGLAGDQGDGLSTWLRSAVFIDPATGANLLDTAIYTSGASMPGWAGDERLARMALPDHRSIAARLAAELEMEK
jgi:hypothetical protein